MRPWTVLVGTLAVGATVAGLLQSLGLSESLVLAVSNVVMSAVVALACATCALAARRSVGRRRAMWLWLSVATGAWTASQLVWTYVAVTQGAGAPFPPAAELGYLFFPIAASTAMVIWLGSQGHELAARGRDVLDGAIIAGSLLVLSWVTVLGAVIEEHDGSWVQLWMALAYPLGDVVLGTLVLIALVRGAPQERFTLGVLAVGLGGLAVSDSAYLYFLSNGAEWSGDVFGIGWYLGFLLVAVAAVTDDGPHDAVVLDRAGASSSYRDLDAGALLRLALPYVPLLAAMAALVASLAGAASAHPTADLLLLVALVLIVLTRQFLAMVDNVRLVLAVEEGRDRLQHLALHDPLTGLPNRVLFADRLDRAVLDPSVSVSVLFCDLDDFKHVNDTYGHDTGDALLCSVAERLRACVRATDTVARLGGDEFAVVLVDAEDAVLVAERIVSSLAQPLVVGDASLSTSVSIGIAHHAGEPLADDDRRGGDGPSGSARPTAAPAGVASRRNTASLLLRTADQAMYEAKRAGKGRAVLAETRAGQHALAPARLTW